MTKTKKIANLILNSKHLVVFTGAGISTESGLPDYRGPDGVWTRRDKGLKPKPSLSINEIKFCRGINYDWSKRINLVSLKAAYSSCNYVLTKPEQRTLTKHRHTKINTKQNWDKNLEGGNWLEATIKEHRDSVLDASKYTPFTLFDKNKGVMNIDIKMAKDDQLDILLEVVAKVKEWINCATSTNPTTSTSFRPMRATIRGCAGSGKSFFIKCLANTIRKIFDNDSVCEIAAPTGAAAHNVGGETLHRKWAINPHDPSADLGPTSRDNLTKKFKRCLAVVLDERSMLTSDVIGAAERNSADTSHGGSHDDEDWGGVCGK